MSDTRPPSADTARSLPGKLEDGALVLVFAAILVLPLLEIGLRPFGISVPAGASLTQHCTFWLGLVGALVAARSGKLLAISTGFPALQDWRADLLVSLRIGFGAGLSATLARAGWQFAMMEKEGGALLVGNIGVWVGLLALPVGFALLTLRQCLGRTPTWRGRVGALAVAAVVFAAFNQETAPAWGVPLGAVVLLAALIAGTPLFAVLGGAAALLFWKDGNPLASLALDHYRLSTNPTLPALPLFTLAGYFLSAGGASKRLVDLCQAIVGRSRLGPALLTVVSCSFFTSLTGASGVTILALGGLLLPILVNARYSERDALGLVTGAGSLGLLFAPCLPLLLYAIIAEVDLRSMFIGALVPGLLLCGVTVAWAALRPRSPERGSMKQEEEVPFWRALGAAFWELLVPVVALGSIFLGWATPVESAALTAGYCLLIETLVYRDLKLSRIPGVLVESGGLIGGVLLILGVALGLTNYLVDAQVPLQLVDFVQAHVSSKWAFLTLLVIVLLIVGCLMDVFSAIVVVVPLIVPLAGAYGIDPIHMGALFLANLGLGFLTPPVGMNLFLASYRFERPMSEILKSVLPLFWLQLAAVLVITYVPILSTWLPNLLK